MMVKVALFAAARDIAKCNELELELDDNACIFDVKNRLSMRFPGLTAIMENSTWSVNHEYVNANKILRDGAEIGLIPPVSGG